MAYSIQFSNRFTKRLKLLQKRGYDLSELNVVIHLLMEQGTLPAKYRPHKLVSRGYANLWECHIKPDWLLVWDQDDEVLHLLMIDTGTHADLF